MDSEYVIPDSWELLKEAPKNIHEKKFLVLLEKHGFDSIKLPVPLISRYKNGRRWLETEFEACFSAWKTGKSLTLIAAALNRNPQDMIYKLLDRCKRDGLKFTQKNRSEGSKNWTLDVENCARELFEAGLAAWKIAVIFQVNFEHVEKALFIKRKGYGHNKKNPFGICTDHKQVINSKVLTTTNIVVRQVLDAFAGEGRFTQVLDSLESIENIFAVEQDTDTFLMAQKKVWANTEWIKEDNLPFIHNLLAKQRRFDLIDLDPFVSCHQQAQIIWPLLEDEALLFITFGGEYRRSFIKTNRKSIAKRYGFCNTSLNNQDYLESVPFFFLGWLANKAVANNITFDIIRAVRYPNNCRFWLRITRTTENIAQNWLSHSVVLVDGGYRFINLYLPRFREVRHEVENIHQLRLFE